MKKVIDEFVEQKQMFMKKFKNIKSIHRCVSKKGVFTTVILNDDRKKTVKLCDGDVDDFEKSVLWAYALIIGQKIINTQSYYNWMIGALNTHR